MPQEGEHILVQRTGQPITGLATMAPIIVGEQIIGVNCIIRDITARRQAEEALRRQRDLYERLVGGLSDMEGSASICAIAWNPHSTSWRREPPRKVSTWPT